MRKSIICWRINIIAIIRHKPQKIILILSIVYPLLLSLNNIINGSIPFWLDPARDFLLALDNLKKPTLIGPPSGVPGIFYGPYWIWMISTCLIFSKDPRFLAVIILIIPYFTIFPYILFKFSHLYGRNISILLWLLFILSYQMYSTFLWNPHLAPLFFLILTYLLIKFFTIEKNQMNYGRMFLAGLICGLIINFHISFGLGIYISSVIFMIINALILIIRKKNRKLKYIIHFIIILTIFICGFLITLIPYVIFEFRHNFIQSKAFINTTLNAVLYDSATVGQTGLKKIEILQQFFIDKPAVLLSLKNEQIAALYIFIIGYLSNLFVKRKLIINKEEKSLLLFLIICSAILLILYLCSKNPVWSYHFIGTEIIILLMIGFVVKKINLLKHVLSYWITIYIIISILSFVASFFRNPYSVSSFATKKFIVDQIFQDAGKQEFSVAVYSPAIHTYDFDYLFNWLGESKYHISPKIDKSQSQLIYLIVPKTSEAIELDFINYKSPNEKYRTVKEWHIPDETKIIKRLL